MDCHFMRSIQRTQPHYVLENLALVPIHMHVQSTEKSWPTGMYQVMQTCTGSSGTDEGILAARLSTNRFEHTWINVDQQHSNLLNYCQINQTCLDNFHSHQSRCL